jgi:hypothetical protein
VIHRTAILTSGSVLLGGVFARLCVLAGRARAIQKRRMHLLEMELRMDALETFRREVFRLKHYRVLRPKVPSRNIGLFPSIKVNSLRYIKGRQNED